MANLHKEGATAIDKFVTKSASVITYQGPSAKKPRVDYSRVTKNITDIFAADPTNLTETGTSFTEGPKRILIEGAPGIGKTVLAKEIAYQWATNEILTEIKIVFLIYLRDPQLQSITTTKQLVEYMSMGCLNDEQITTFNTYLVNSKGQQLCIVMDGFDEYPTSLQENSFIVDIINGRVLPEAIVVITSRPTATVSLHDRVDRRIDILGLPKEERDKYISQVLSCTPTKKTELERHLKQKPVINGLCFVPLHLAVLLYLFQQGSLPETLTEMNESFILHTIYRHLKKHGKTPSGLISKLKDVPKPVLDIVYDLSKLGFKGLQENKLVFTYEEIRQVCPFIDETVGAINGFGLLQAVQHYPHKGAAAGTTTSHNFLHYTMQEYLAALHVSNLPSEQQSSLMKKTFWDGHYNFMWMMFVGIVGINSDIFVNFVSKGKVYKRKSGIRMAENILSDKRKRLHVFQCYMEAKSSTEAPDVIFDMFKDDKVIINKVKLLPHHISSLMTFMSNSSMQWKTLELKVCNITDVGMNVLEQFILENLSTLEYADLSHNVSSPWGVYCAIIRHCSVNNLTLSGVQASEMKDYVNEITESLRKNTNLTSLTLCNILGNIQPIKTVLSCITTCTDLNIPCRKVVDHNDVHRVKAVLFHTTLQYKCDDTVLVSDNRRKAKVNLLCDNLCDALTVDNLYSLDASHQCIDHYGLTVVATFCDKILNLSRNEISDDGALAISDCIKSHTCLLELNLSMNAINDCGARDIAEAICVNTVLQKLDLSNNYITSWGAKKIAGAIQANTTLNTLDITNNKVGDDGAAAISDSLKTNTSLQSLSIAGNYITNEGAQKIAEAIRANTTLYTLDIANNKVGDDGAAAISDSLKTNTSLQSLIISGNYITSKGAQKIAEAIQVNTTLNALDISNAKISDDGVVAISNSLRCNNSLQSLNISHNSITNKGIIAITKSIQINSTLQNINISKNHISIKALLYFMEAVKNNCTLQVVNITHNNVTRSGFTSIKQCIENLQRTIQIYASWNEIVTRNGKLLVTSKICTFQESKNIIEEEWSFKDYDPDHIVTCLSECLKEDDMLLELNMSKNWIIRGRENKIIEAIVVNKILLKLDASLMKLQDESCISDCLKINKSLKELNMSKNEITSNGAKEIATAIRVNTTLEKLDLSCNALSDDGVNFISDGLKNNNSLKEVNISRNKITSEGAQYIADAIRINTTLVKLDLSCNTLSDDGAIAISDSLQSNKGITKITEAIQTSLTLQNIDISKNNISIEGLVYFMEAVKNNCTLQVVNITHNNVIRSGFTSIKQCIENLQHPIQIYASWNELNQYGKLVTKISTSCAPDNIEDDVWSFDEYNADRLVMCLSECLKEDDTLQELNMSYNKITNEGAKMISEAIKVNKTLQKLNISENSISDDGAAAISDGLKCNSSLQELNISWNKITKEGIKLIAEAIKVNTTLHTLNLYQYSINGALSCNMTVLTAVYHNNTLMKLTLPWVFGDDERLVSSEVEKINKERTRQGISTLTCDYS